jgi:cytochrome b561
MRRTLTRAPDGPPLRVKTERRAIMIKHTAEPGRYGPAAIALHWTVFVLVVVVGIMGLLHDNWPHATQAFWINIHAMIGLLLLATVLYRIVWRQMHTPPDLPPDIGEFSRRLSYPVHLVLYLLLLAIPALGIITFIWHGRVFDFGLFQINPGVTRDVKIFHPTEEWHGYLAYALFGLAGLHALAALWHHFVRKDGVLRRMLPGLPRP